MDRAVSHGQEGAALLAVLGGRAQAEARLAGSGDGAGISGTVRFYQTGRGAVIWAQAEGLPRGEGPCGGRIFGFHIHEGDECGGSMDDPFAHAMSHYDPEGCEHPYHAGDLPPLFGCGGQALSVFLTDRFTVDEVIGRTVIVHDRPDDFTSQPSGGAGAKIACGAIRRVGPCPWAGRV